MKTEGLTIQEAVKALDDHKCSMIKNERNGCLYTGMSMYDLFSCSEILDTYTLINPKPKMEDVEVSRWINVRRNGRIGSNLYKSKMEAIDCSKHWAEPAIQKEIKIKVEREVED